MLTSNAKAGAWLGVASAVCLLAGCGSSSKPTPKVTSSAYVSSVCTSVGGWLHDIESSSGQITAKVGTAATPARAKAALEALVGQAAASSQDVVVSLRAAGVPDVANGQRIAATLVGTFDHAAAGMQSLLARVRSLPTTSSAFAAAARNLATSLQGSLSSMGSGLQALRSPELQKAAAASAACQHLASATSS